jgi:hypothetical protein
MLTRKDPSALAEITRDSGLNFSENTIARALRAGYYVPIARKKPFLIKRKKSIGYTRCELQQK